MINPITILWADDEIDLLKPHILFLEEKGYKVLSTESGNGALDILKENRVDIVFLDENMPGLTGLETLLKIKEENASLPIIMITKSEEEYIMEEAIGSQISDYLIKPVHPNQILLSIKKNTDASRLVSKQVTTKYQQEFREISMNLNEHLDTEEWMDLYKRLVYWELQLDKSQENEMEEVFLMQKNEANQRFGKFIKDNYTYWIGHPEDAPILSHTLFKNTIIPMLKKEEEAPLFFILIDNLRLDHWEIIKPLLTDDFWIEDEDLFFSILPTTTQYSRNAIFSGMLPSEMEKKFPDKWSNDEDEGGKNLHEKEFLKSQLEANGLDIKYSYNKVLNEDYGNKLVKQVNNMFDNKLNVIVYNFVDMLSHARTDTQVVKELASNEAAYRSIVYSWFQHSSLLTILKDVAKQGGKLVITTDHGSIRVKSPIKIVGEKTINTNLRYKQGKTLHFAEKEVFSVSNPLEAGLPKVNVNQQFVFTKDDSFFAYPNNFNHYAKYYTDTFQHGGVSLEEMMIPVVKLSPKKK